ncbi:hypothetical protein S245_048818, partial [Arachis hypogaea]
KGLTKPYAYGYNRVSASDLALEERELGFVSFNANNVYEWNIDGKTKYNIMSMLQHMTMVGTAYQAAHETSEEAIANVIVSGFSGQLKGWWDNYLSDNQKHSIFSAKKVNDQNEPIIGDDGKPIPDVANTLIFTIASHFIGAKLFLTFGGIKTPFLLGSIPGKTVNNLSGKKNSLQDFPNPWEINYGQLISFIQKVALKIFQDDKIQRQLAREKTQNRIDLGNFCEQFCLLACHPRKSKRPSNKTVFKPNPEKIFRRSRKGFQNSKNEKSIQKNFQKYPQKNPIICYICKKSGHVSKYCRLKRKINNLNLDPQIEDQINNLLIDGNLWMISTISNVLSKDQDLLFDAIEAIGDPEQKKNFLLKLKRSLQKEKKPKNLVLSNKYN